MQPSRPEHDCAGHAAVLAANGGHVKLRVTHLLELDRQLFAENNASKRRLDIEEPHVAVEPDTNSDVPEAPVCWDGPDCPEAPAPPLIVGLQLGKNAA